MSKTKYLITGGAGFIGANFVKHLLRTYADDVEILIFDALTYAANLLTIKEELEADNVCFVHADITDADAVKKAIETFDPDFVVNFAAETHVDRSITNPRLFLETNIIGTQTLLDAVKTAWALPSQKKGENRYKPGKRYLQISTDEVYGSLERRPGEPKPLFLSPELARVAADRTNLQQYGDGLFTESTPLAPRSPYSASKTSADMLVMAYHETYGLPVVVTRCSNNYGPSQFPEKLIPLAINNLLGGKEIPVYGRGENVRDWLYVDDHCSAIDTVLRNGRTGEVYNIGGFNEMDNLSIVTLIINTVRRLMTENERYRQMLTGDVADITPEKKIRFVTDRPGHDMRYAIDPTKIAVELGWYPRTCFPVGIEKTIRWYLDNPEWTAAVTSGAYKDYYSAMYDNR